MAFFVKLSYSFQNTSKTEQQKPPKKVAFAISSPLDTIS